MAAMHMAPLLRQEALTCIRMSAAEWRARSASALPPIGGLGWGVAAPGLASLDVPVLSAGGPCVDAWFGAAALRRGRSGDVQWQDDGRWAFGHLDVADAETDLAETTRRAYLDVFAALRACGRPQLLRLWNYLPRINADGGGLERYRQFNIGRQQAFIEAGHDIGAGSPAACALGTSGGGLGIRFLASATAPRPLENPRQVSAYRYSAAHGPRSPTFSRGALADAGAGRLALFVSGTASIVGERSMHPGDVHAQTAETLMNLQAVLAAAHAQGSAAFTLADLSCTVYVRHRTDEAAIRALASSAMPHAVYLQADICRSELLVEIEGHAFAPGALK
ncbi:MAG: hypothetical protein Q7U73_16780 [Rubrivivax sp.]|nr:hypothetical protein [Rubrivivax sp.]